MSDELMRAAMRAGGRLADGLAEPTAMPHSLRYATLVSVEGGKATVEMMGGTLAGLDMAVGAAAAAPGDRVVVETYGTLAIVTGVVLGHDDVGYSRRAWKLQTVGLGSADGSCVVQNRMCSFRVFGQCSASHDPWDGWTVATGLPKPATSPNYISPVWQESDKPGFMMVSDDGTLYFEGKGGRSVSAGDWVFASATYIID